MSDDDKRTRFHALAEELEPAPTFCTACGVLLGETDFSKCKRCTATVEEQLDTLASAWSGITVQAGSPPSWQTMTAAPLTEETIIDAAKKLVEWRPPQAVLMPAAMFQQVSADNLQRVIAARRSVYLMLRNVARPVIGITCYRESIEFGTYGSYTPDDFDGSYLVVIMADETQNVNIPIWVCATQTDFSGDKQAITKVCAYRAL